MNNPFHLFFYITLALSIAMVTACADAPPPTACEQNKKTGSSMANPAATQCLNDGYQLKPIIEKGIPKGYLCVNPHTGKKCEVWDYFHKKCDLK